MNPTSPLAANADWPSTGDASDAPVWVLLGARHGDNQQLLAMADALGVPYRRVPLTFNRGARWPLTRFGGHRLTWRSDVPLAPPWPRVVLAAGRRSVPAALWLQRRSRGATRLVHVNRPWAPLDRFDLVVTTPQYGLPARHNVLVRHLPFLPPVLAEAPLPPAWRARAASMPRPWTAVLVGASSRPYVLDATAAAQLAAHVNGAVRGSGGSAWVLAGPRTSAATMAALEAGLDVPAAVVRWDEADNPYPALRGLADRFVVTGDSASMLAEALLSGRPVAPFALALRSDWRWRWATAWRRAAVAAPRSWRGRTWRAAVELGLLASGRDLGLLQQALADAEVLGDGGRALALAQAERAETLARIRALLERP